MNKINLYGLTEINPYFLYGFLNSFYFFFSSLNNLKMYIFSFHFHDKQNIKNYYYIF